MRHKDELDELIRRGAHGPDGELAHLFVAMRSAARGAPPVPSRALASVLLGATPIDLLTPEDLARSPRPARAGRGGWLAGRLAALAPATKFLLAGSVAVAAVTVSVAVNELTEDRLRVNIVTPATPTPESTTSDSATSDPSTPAPSSLATTSPPASSKSTTSRPDRSEPGRSASSTRSRDGSDTSTRSRPSSPRSTSREASPTSRSTTETETETSEPTSDASTVEGTSSGKGSARSNGDTSGE